MQFIQIENKHKDKYCAFVNNKLESTCVQMWEWAQFRNKLGSKLYDRVGIIDTENNFHLTATYQISRFKMFGNILYLPQGPIWDKANALKIFTQEIESIARKNNCIAIACDPRIRRDKRKFKELISNGFKFTDKAVQPRVTVLLDLNQSDDDLLASFSKSTRYNIRYAERKGVQVKKYSNPEDIVHISKFYNLLKITQQRRYFQVQKLDYFKKLWQEFSKNNHATLYAAIFKDKILATIIVLNNNVWTGSLFSSSTREFSNLKPTYLLRWESIKDAKEKGSKIYDFFGATDSTDVSHPFYNTTQFKLGFGRKLTKFAGTFEIIINPLKYRAWKLFETCGLFKFYEDSFIKEFRKKNARER